MPLFFLPWLMLAALCLVTQSCPTLCDPMDCGPPGSSVLRDSPGEYWRGLPWPPPGDLPDPGIEPRFPALQADSLSAELPGKPKNTGMGSLSLLQQESNRDHPYFTDEETEAQRS